ncbi:LysR family transcriptional regulator [Vibrio sp. HN007]|uniref:LysR family transcriptional regulator n=1 Tax=Vibrio iocasae TaxID=3098914 RepID=UPI0035D4DF70
MINNINLADIRSFVLIAQLGNFTKAAEALSVSRSHVSRQISSLESQMGVTLLTRTTRTLSLTLAGERFYKQCEKALNGIDQALIAAVDDTEEVRGLIRINCVGGYIGEEIISRYVADFMSLYPLVQISLDFSSHRVDLIQDEFDIAFRMGELEDSGFVAKRLMDIEIVTLASPEYIQKYGNPEHPKELSQHRCLTGSVKRWSFQYVADNSEHSDVNVDGQLVCKNGHALVTGALSGNGIIRVPLMYCSDDVKKGKLTRILPDWEIPKVLFSAIYHKDKYQPIRLRTFIEFVKKRFEEEIR